MRQNEQGQYVSDDGHWVWDGTQWVPTAEQEPALAVAAHAGEVAVGSVGSSYDAGVQVSGDAHQSIAVADGAAVPAQAVANAPVAEVTATTVEIHVDRAHPLSPDGRHWWTGDEWVEVPAAEAAQPAAESVTETPAATTTAESPVETATVTPAVDTVDASTSVQAQRQLSPDGFWEWDGTQWVPAQQLGDAGQPAAQTTQQAVQPTQVQRQLSPDGQWEWDGTQWVPAQAAAQAVPAGAHVSPDGHWWWNGTQWVPTGR